jgi:hypothetical protein
VPATDDLLDAVADVGGVDAHARECCAGEPRVTRHSVKVA